MRDGWESGSGNGDGTEAVPFFVLYHALHGCSFAYRLGTFEKLSDLHTWLGLTCGRTLRTVRFDSLFYTAEDLLCPRRSRIRECGEEQTSRPGEP